MENKKGIILHVETRNGKDYPVKEDWEKLSKEEKEIMLKIGVSLEN